MPNSNSYKDLYHSPLLIVEPTREIRVELARAFQRSGLRLLAASTGQEALDIIRGLGVPALAIIEIALPDMSGVELATKLKQSKNIPIILSGYMTDPDRVAVLLDLVAEDFVAKPIDAREVAARAYRILLRRRQLNGLPGNHEVQLFHHAERNKDAHKWMH